MTKKKLTLTAAMIVRDGGELFKQCLESITPLVDELIVVDTGSKDESRALAKSHGARLFEFEWVDSFAAARNESWKHIRTTHALWLDHDDVILGGEHLRPKLAEIEAIKEAHGLWCPYQYAFDSYGNCTTVHTRERVVKMDRPWKWKNRIHETVSTQVPGVWYRCEEVIWKHLRQPKPQMERNLRLLFMDYAEEPDSPRTVLYIGHQYFSGGEWGKAAEWYERFAMDMRGLVVERWQALCYLARCCRMMGDTNAALKWAWAAVSIAPWWQDGYLQIAEAHAMTEEWDKVIYWAEYSRTQEKPPEPVFTNPVEEAAQAACLLERAYGIAGDYPKAVAENDRARRYMPKEENLIHNGKLFRDAIGQVKLRDGYVNLARRMSDSKRISLAKSLNGVVQEPDVRDILVPALIRKAKRGTQPDVTIFCGETLDEWTPPTLEQTGIGGSETAVVEIAKRLNGAGFRTCVYGKPGPAEGFHDGVGYIDWRRWRDTNKTDTFIAWRTPFEEHGNVQAQRKWLWMHDLNKGVMPNEANTHFYDAIYAVSQFHADYLAKAYPFLADRVSHLPNGVNLERFQQSVGRQRNKVVWLSSPDRGLIHLLNAWPNIMQAEPSAQLHIFYGWDNIDKMIAMGYSDLAAYKLMVLQALKQPGVFWRGRVNQNELAKELLSAEAWAYPTSFVETGGISAVEALAADCYIVTSALGNLPEIVGDAGWCIPGHPGTPTYQKRFVGLLAGGLLDVQLKHSFDGKRVPRAQMFTWDRAFERHWLPALQLVKVLA